MKRKCLVMWRHTGKMHLLVVGASNGYWRPYGQCSQGSRDILGKALIKVETRRAYLTLCLQMLLLAVCREKIREKKLTANRKQTEALGLMAIVSPQV